MTPVYLDNAATTKPDTRVLEAMLPYLAEDYGNASSIHGLGRKTNVAVEEARETIARLLNTKPAQIIFTSGGTESNNAIIKGVLKATGKNRVITSPLEHHAVLHPLEHDNTIETVFLGVSKTGHIDLDELKSKLNSETALVSLMHVNNEIGTKNPIKEIAEICREHGVAFHSDTVQSVGKFPIDVTDLDVDFITLSAHKFYGPKGVGAMYIHPDALWQPWMEGGSQERKRRGGTLNVPGIIGMAKALQLAHEEMEENKRHITKLKNALIGGLKERFPDLAVTNGDTEHGGYHIVNVSFPMPDGNALDGEMLLLNLDIEGVYCSNGSACTSGAVEASHVLLGIGIDEKTAKSSIRFSLSKYNTESEIDYTLEKLEQVLNRMTS